MQRRALPVVISVLAIAVVCSSFIPYLIVFAEPSGPITCNRTGTMTTTCCQDHIINRSPANPAGTLVRYCADCQVPPGGSGTVEEHRNCGERYIDMSAEQPPTPQPFDPTAPLQGGVLEQPPSPPPSGSVAPFKGGILEQLEQGNPEIGFSQQQQQQLPPADQGAAELPPPPATEETQPATEQSVPVCQEGLEFNEDLGFCVPENCPEGQELNEETGICVLEEQPASAEEPQAEEPTEPQSDDEEQSSDQEDLLAP